MCKNIYNIIYKSYKRGFIMKNIVKYSMLVGALCLVSMTVNAEITVKDTTSPEFIHNSGYSSEVSRIIDVKTKDYAKQYDIGFR